MAFPAPHGFFNALVRQGGHGKAGMRDAEPAFFLGKDRCGGVHRLAFRLGCRHGPGTVDAVTEKQVVNSTHMRIGQPDAAKSKWDSTDAGY